MPRRLRRRSSLSELRNNAEAAGISAGLQFTARLLERAASPELEAKLIDLALEDMRTLPSDQIARLRLACRDARPQVKEAPFFAQKKAHSMNQPVVCADLLPMTLVCV